MPNLHRYAREQMKGEPIWLNFLHAETFRAEVQRTAQFRCWDLRAVAIMANHVHLVVIGPDDWPGERLMQVFKSYGSRAMNQQHGKPRSGTWWTRSGSTRWLRDDRAIRSATEYVRRQHRPLAVWVAE